MRHTKTCKQCGNPFSWSDHDGRLEPTFCGACNPEGIQYNL